MSHFQWTLANRWDLKASNHFAKWSYLQTWGQIAVGRNNISLFSMTQIEEELYYSLLITGRQFYILCDRAYFVRHHLVT